MNFPTVFIISASSSLLFSYILKKDFDVFNFLFGRIGLPMNIYNVAKDDEDITKSEIEKKTENIPQKIKDSLKNEK